MASRLAVGFAAAYHFMSVAQQTRFVASRNRLRAATTDSDRESARKNLRILIRDEMRLAKLLYDEASEDSRLGFEATNHYYYTPIDLVEKVINCRDLLDRWLKD